MEYAGPGCDDQYAQGMYKGWCGALGIAESVAKQQGLFSRFRMHSYGPWIEFKRSQTPPGLRCTSELARVLQRLLQYQDSLRYALNAVEHMTDSRTTRCDSTVPMDVRSYS